MTLLTIILLPLLVGTTLALLAARFSRVASAWAVAGITATSLGLLLSYSSRIFSGEKIIAKYTWLPELVLILPFVSMDLLIYLLF